MNTAGAMVEDLRFYLRSEARSRTSDLSFRDDLVQEAMIVIVEVVSRYRDKPPEELIKLAKRSACNRMTDIMRRRKAYEKYINRFTTMYKEPVFDPGELAAKEELFQFIESKLQPHEAEALRLLLVGHDANSVSELLGRSRSAVYRDIDAVAREVVKWWE